MPTTAPSLDALAHTRHLRRLALAHGLATSVAPLVQSTGLELVRLAFFPELVDVSPLATLPSRRSPTLERSRR